MPNLDPDFLTFLRSSIPSVWALEVLLLLKRRSETRWTVADIDKELRASPHLVAGCLAQLQRSGLVSHDDQGAWRYATASLEIEAHAVRLEAMFRERPLAIINTILSGGDERLRNFADAFRFKDKDE